MKKAIIGMAVLACIVCSGCQSVSRIEYFEPTQANADYSVKTSDTALGHGPIKAIEGKSGVPDFSDNKTFKFSLNFLGL